jgi:hypothetical protein
MVFLGLLEERYMYIPSVTLGTQTHCLIGALLSLLFEDSDRITPDRRFFCISVLSLPSVCYFRFVGCSVIQRI